MSRVAVKREATAQGQGRGQGKAGQGRAKASVDITYAHACTCLHGIAHLNHKKPLTHCYSLQSDHLTACIVPASTTAPNEHIVLYNIFCTTE